MATIHVSLKLKPEALLKEYGALLFSDASVTSLTFKRESMAIDFEATAESQGDLTLGIIIQLWALKGVKSLNMVDLSNGNGAPIGPEVPTPQQRRPRRAPAS